MRSGGTPGVDPLFEAVGPTEGDARGIAAQKNTSKITLFVLPVEI